MTPLPYAAPARAVSFFGHTWEEAWLLLAETRDYVAHREAADRARLAPPDQLRLCGEALRVTARLTRIVAWLLTQRAVHAGEMTAIAAVADPLPLAALGVCMVAGEDGIDALPRRLTSLLDRSHRLYIRVARLDDLARRRAA